MTGKVKPPVLKNGDSESERERLTMVGMVRCFNHLYILYIGENGEGPLDLLRSYLDVSHMSVTVYRT